MFFKSKPGFSSLSMRQAAQELAQNPSIRLLDVRTPEEHAQGHIPGSINLPLNQISQAPRQLPDKQARLFVYCLSGARSRAAAAQLAALGYTNVVNIGAITAWPGSIERKVSA